MLPIVRFIGVLCTGLLVALAVPAMPAKAAELPKGSYQQSCTVYSVTDTTLTAGCKNKAGKTKLNRNFKYPYCLSDISNQDGLLACAIDANKLAADQARAAAIAQAEADKKKAEADAVAAAALKIQQEGQAKPAFASAANVFIGRDAAPAELTQWLALMQSPAYGMAAQAADGVSFAEASAFFRAYLAKPENAKLRAEAIDNAFREIHGRPSKAVEQAKWDAQVKAGKAWYTTIVLQEQGAMMGSETAHKAAINSAYFAAFGRDPSAAELGYYMSRNEHFRQIVALNRNWLHSGSGAAELVLTIARAQIAKGQTPDDASIKAALPGYSAKRAIYAEML